MTITPIQKEIIEGLNDPLYTVEFLEEWIDRNDNVFTNPVAALQAMGAKGFYSAVKAMETYLAPKKPVMIYGKKVGYMGCMCPVCKSPMHPGIEKDNHCRECGQKIDWSGRNGK